MDALKRRSIAHQRYRDSAGHIVPGVTTVCGLLAKPQLVKWANRMGLEGINTDTYVDAAARVGTLAHCLVQQHLAAMVDLPGFEVDFSQYSPDEINLAETALIKFFEWDDSHHCTPIFLEQQFVSDDYGFGGSIDCYALIDGEPWLIDFKTGKAIYDDYAMQVAAYKKLLEEDGYPVHGVRIIRIGRDEMEGFEDKVYGKDEIDKAWQLFGCLLEFHHIKNAKVKK